LQYRLDSGVAVVTVAGELDVSTSGLLRDGLLRVLTDETHRGLVVNLAGVNFIDSTGIGVLVGVWHRVGAMNSSLALAAPSPRAPSDGPEGALRLAPRSARPRAWPRPGSPRWRYRRGQAG